MSSGGAAQLAWQKVFLRCASQTIVSTCFAVTDIITLNLFVEFVTFIWTFSWGKLVQMIWI